MIRTGLRISSCNLRQARKDVPVTTGWNQVLPHAGVIGKCCRISCALGRIKSGRAYKGHHQSLFAQSCIDHQSPPSVPDGGEHHVERS